MSKNRPVSRSAGGFTAFRLASDALLIALYFVLSFFTSRLVLGGVRISFAALPLVICAMLYGPWDALLVGLLGEFLTQLLAWGLTATTALWCIPEALRGLMLGLGALAFAGKMPPYAGKRVKNYMLYLALCVAAGIVTSCANTLVYYVDAKLFGYYAYALIFGVFWLRLLVGAGTAVLTGAAGVWLLLPLKAAGWTRLPGGQTKGSGTI
jgi:ECF transporter S component (folate family)